MKCGYLYSSAIILAVAMVVPAAFAKQYVYPAKGQSAQQQQKDEAECYTWAVQQTGFDPAKPQPQQQASSKAATTATGTTPGAGVRGAAGGAVVGAIAGDAGAGAAAGAVVARSQSRRQNTAAAQTAAATTAIGHYAATGCLREGARCVP